MSLDNLLSLKNCSLEVPTTGLYIDELGITDTLLGQLNSDQYESGVDLFKEKRSFAWRKLSSDILSNLSPMMKADTIIEGKRIGQMKSNALEVEGALGSGKYGGIRVIIQPNHLSYLKFYISEITISLSSATLNTLVRVFDMNTLKQVDSFMYQTGAVEQFIGKTYNAKRRKLDLSFVYESLEQTTKLQVKKGSCYDCGGRLKLSHICPFVDAVGIEITVSGDTVTYSNSKQFTSGMSFNYNVSCDRENWLYSIGGLMALPLAYGTAVEIYDYALMVSPSQRVNTTVDLMRDELMSARDIAASRYTTELGTILQNMRLPNDKNCFDCKKNMSFISRISYDRI